MMNRVDYLRISITDRCNFRCVYCMPPEGIPWKPQADILSFEEIVRFTEAAAAAGVSRVRITGGEPLVRRHCVSLVEQLEAVTGIEDLSLTTNGSLLTGCSRELKRAGLSRLNISIPSLDPGRFSRLTGGAGLEPVLTGLDSALTAGFSPVKINVVALAGVEDDLERFASLTRRQPVHVRFIEQMPIGGIDADGIGADGGRFISREWLLAELRAYGELAPAPSPGGGGPARYFRFSGAAGTIGFISSMSDHICGDCNRLRLTADGYLRGCLFSGDEVYVRPLIGRDPARLKETIMAAIGAKKFDRGGARPGPRTMSQIGG
ncbi:MAG: GTP 3',8-cyclase MoaA [Actinobacteria bacterium]|nr:GTP 3',8-cyclase MoaA [Actinomycetota bacterium]